MTKGTVKQSNKKKMILIIIGVVIVFATAFVGYFGYLTYGFYQVNNEIYEPIPETKMREEPVDTKTLEPVSVLLMGIDSKDEIDSGRSDTMIVATINPENRSTTTVSIPRDSYTLIEGYENDKINHAYAFGGAELAVKTVENFLDIPIDFYVTMDFQGFVDLVNIFGRITVQNTFPFSYEGHDFPIGELNLTGEEALAYSRMRYEDPNGDVGRQLRQQQVIKSLIEEAKEIKSASQISKIYATLGEHIETNLSPNEIWNMMWDYVPALESVINIQLHFNGFKGEDGIYYAGINDEVRVQVSNTLRESLGLMVRDKQYYIDKEYKISPENTSTSEMTLYIN